MAVFVAVSVKKQNKKQFASSQTEISFIKKKKNPERYAVVAWPSLQVKPVLMFFIKRNHTKML